MTQKGTYVRQWINQNEQLKAKYVRYCNKLNIMHHQ